METETEAEGVGLLLLVADCVFDEDVEMELVGEAVMLCVRVEVAENDGLHEAEEELEVEPDLETLGLGDRDIDEV